MIVLENFNNSFFFNLPCIWLKFKKKNERKDRKKNDEREVVLCVAPGVMQSVVHVCLNGPSPRRKLVGNDQRNFVFLPGCTKSIATLLQFIAPGAMAQYPKLQF